MITHSWSGHDDPLPTELPERGDSNKWADLTESEAHCLYGLQNYYIKVEDRNSVTAFALSWLDLQKEFPRLKDFLWYKSEWKNDSKSEV